MDHSNSRFLPWLASCFFFFSLLFSPPYSAQAEKQVKVALVMKALTNPFFTKLDKGAREYAAKHAVPLEVYGLERETDVEHQISIVENLIARDTGAIIIAPSDSQRLIPVCLQAMKQGITVINIDNPLDQEILQQHNVSIPFIGPDNVQGSRFIGEYIRNLLGGKGRVLIIEGIPGAFNSDARKKGFIEGVSLDSSIEVSDVLKGNWHSDEAFSAVVSALEKDSRIDAILCANDVMALGALRALDLFGLASKILVTGYDNIGPVRDEILSNRIHATIEQHPEVMGEAGVKAAWNSLNKNLAAQSQDTPVKLITRAPMGKNVLFFVSTLENPFFSIMVESARKEAELHGIRLAIFDADNDDAKQLVDIMDSLSGKPDLLIVNPTNSDTILPALEAAAVSGIPVISVDRRVTASKVLSNISSDNRMGGKLAARFIADKLGGKGQILELEGIPGTSATHDRGVGFNEEILRYPGVTIPYREVANFDRNKARSVVIYSLARGKKFDGAFAHNDNMILGLIDAFETVGVALPKVIVGFDGVAAAVRSIREGKLTATVAQRPDQMGILAVSTAASYFRGESVPQEIFVDLKLIKD